MDQKEILLLLLFIGCLSLEQEPKIKKHHSVHWGLNPPPQKHHSPRSCQAPLKSANSPSPPFLGNPPPPLYWFFVFTMGIFHGSSLKTDKEPKEYSTTQYLFVIPPIRF